MILTYWSSPPILAASDDGDSRSKPYEPSRSRCRKTCREASDPSTSLRVILSLSKDDTALGWVPNALGHETVRREARLSERRIRFAERVAVVAEAGLLAEQTL